MPLRWAHFNAESTETGGATAGQAWITDCTKERKDYLLTEEEEEDEVDQRLSALETAQEKFHRDLEEVIRVILDMVVRALQAERNARQAPDQDGWQPAPREPANPLGGGLQDEFPIKGHPDPNPGLLHHIAPRI
ncbi:UNVERIFIED_CONTAM: hypothetical protein K2H54_062606 [Gekko kuhli]